MPERSSHLDEAGRARMVDVSAKPETERRARASCSIQLGTAAAEAMRSGSAGKGDVAAAARLAGIQAAKRTSEWIPLCHPLRTTSVAVDLEFAGETTLVVTSEAAGVDRTGFEMEALVAAAAAALTVYDMLKSVERGITITGLGLIEKSGGKSGPWTREEPQ
ncbi:MAG: cyclic pyranopterin monophosphate synthase MoaC [Planctomycetota bacterium]|jgi:cyclic pyranopterin phosphate synthase